MPTGPLTMQVKLDVKLMMLQVQQLADLLEHLPKRRSRQFARKAFCLLHGVELRKVRGGKSCAADIAGDLTFQARVVGLDELIAAAMRAGQREVCHE